MSVREHFVKTFGEEAAVALEAASAAHEDMLSGHNYGSDPFKYVLCVCIGFECMELSEYRDHHGITPSWESLSQWIKDHGELSTHDGDVDYMALLAGKYNPFVPVEVTE